MAVVVASSEQLYDPNGTLGLSTRKAGVDVDGPAQTRSRRPKPSQKSNESISTLPDEQDVGRNSSSSGKAAEPILQVPAPTKSRRKTKLKSKQSQQSLQASAMSSNRSISTAGSRAQIHTAKRTGSAASMRRGDSAIALGRSRAVSSQSRVLGATSVSRISGRTASRLNLGTAKRRGSASVPVDSTSAKSKLKKPPSAPPRRLTHEERSLLHACEGTDLDAVYKMLWQNPDVNCKKPVFGSSPLSVACRKGNAKIAEILLSFGADVSAADEYGVTPLHWAANSGDAVLVMLLLRMARNAGVLLPALASLSPADSLSNNAPNILGRRDLFGSTPLHFASVNNRADIARALVAAGSDPMAVNNDGRRPSELTTDIALKAYLKDEEHRMQKYHAAFQRVIRKAAAAGGMPPTRQAASASSRDTSRGQSNTGAKSPSRPATTALARARSRSGPIKQASRQGTKKKRVEGSKPPTRSDEDGDLPNTTVQEVFVLQQAAVAIPVSNAAPPSGDSPMTV
ncbi:hypothetical protein HDU85_002623 [Gaertneriomyces sp. JEL0708]|nr:hypothetical protein HDU85_002623 [Gaertneriomyces sp. JEL0708]